MDIKKEKQHLDREVEASEDELKGVAYTAVSLIGFVIVLIGTVVVAVF